MDEHFALFHEEQRFTQWWVWLIILVGIAPAWYIWWKQVVLREASGSDPTSEWTAWIVWLGAGVLLPVFLASMRLVTQVRHDGIYLRFIPFHWRWVRIEPERIKGVQARTYNPLLEYGGCGIRYGARGKAYTISGNRGVELEFANGRTLLIGSQRAEELASVIRGLLT